MNMRTQGVGLTLLVGFLATYQVSAIPTVTIDDTKGPIKVTSTGFSMFQSGTLGNSDAIWWYGLASDLGLGAKSGLWTHPGSSQVNSEFLVVAGLGVAYGVFVSDLSGIPTMATIPGTNIKIDLTKFLGTSVNTGELTEISPDPKQLSVQAASSIAASTIADGGSTVILLGLGLVGLACLARNSHTHSRTANLRVS